MKDSVYQHLMDYAMRALGRRAHTVLEMRQKLQKRVHHTRDHEEQIISRLMELKLLDDEAYVKRAIEKATHFNPQGRFKVSQTLSRKGIQPELTNKIWNKLKVSEKELAKMALRKLKTQLQRTPPEKRYLKRAQFLASRGFPPEIVFELAKQDETG